MSLRKKIKWLILGTLGLGLLLFLTLIIHITVMVYHKAPLPFEHLQMARADFQQTLSPDKIAALTARVTAQNGVQSTYFNPTSTALVYTFENRQIDAQKIYQTAIQDPAIPSTPYKVRAEDLANGCPVMDNNSFYSQLTATISKIVN
jgi:hypothetical protein